MSETWKMTSRLKKSKIFFCFQIELDSKLTNKLRRTSTAKISFFDHHQLRNVFDNLCNATLGPKLKKKEKLCESFWFVFLLTDSDHVRRNVNANYFTSVFLSGKIENKQVIKEKRLSQRQTFAIWNELPPVALPKFRRRWSPVKFKRSVNSSVSWAPPIVTKPSPRTDSYFIMFFSAYSEWSRKSWSVL